MLAMISTCGADNDDDDDDDWKVIGLRILGKGVKSSLYCRPRLLSRFPL